MQDAFVFQNAIIKSLETKLIGTQSMLRIADAQSPAQAFRALTDLGFGGGGNIKSGDFDALFAFEEDKLAAFIGEFNVKGVLDVFLVENDFLSLKSIFKAIAMGQEPQRRNADGLFGFDELVQAAKGEAQPPKCLAEAVEALKAQVEGGASARAIDVEADKHMFKTMFALARRKEIKAYVQKRLDYANLIIFLRVRRLGLSPKFLDEILIDGGSVRLADVLEASDEKVSERLKAYDVYAEAQAVLEGGEIGRLEAECDNRLLAHFKALKDDMFSEAPIVYYYLSKKTELKVAKLLAAGVINKVPAENIKKRMRDLYA